MGRTRSSPSGPRTPEGIPLDDDDTDNSDEIMVTITVTDVNEPPAIAGNAAVTFNGEAAA